MSHHAQAVRRVPLQRQDWRLLGAAAAVAVVYYAGAKLGLALTFAPYPISVLWPPNALLFAALLLVPPSRWWALILGVLPAHLLAELQGGVPSAMVLCWYVSNVSEALLGALTVRLFAGSLDGLDRLREVTVFCGAALFASTFSSFLDAGFVRLIGWGEVGYWDLWRARLFTNVLTSLVFVPLAVTWARAGRFELRHERGRYLEAGTLLAGLLTVTLVTFDSGIPEPAASPSLLYLPVPFLLWAALRFSPRLSSLCFSIFAFLVIWGAAHGRGPFLYAATHDHVLPIQLFLVSLAVPLLLLAAMMEERRQRERKLRSSEALFSTAFHSSPDAIALSRRGDGRIVQANERWLSMLGGLSEPRDAAGLAPLAAHLAPGARPGAGDGVRDAPVTLIDPGGREWNALVSVQAIELEGEPALLTVVRDVTAQRRSEREAQEQREQLAHLTRVASLADFSGALAHELNQPLTAILSNAQAAQRLIERQPLNVPEIRAILGEIVESDKRAGLVIQRLRRLMKKGTQDFARIDLNQLVAEVLEFVRGQFSTLDIELHATLAPDLPPVRGDRVQLQQLLMNLISNACEAMQGAGTPVKRLSVITLHGRDGQPQLLVADTGPGIASGALETVFTPFFTSKESGLGLGLSICRTIATAHGGTLVAEHCGGGGARFRLVMPPAGD